MPSGKNRAPNGKKPREEFHMAVDIGNTQTVIGLFRNGEIQRRWRLATRKDTTVDEIAFSLCALGLLLEGIKGIAIASVVPKQDAVWMAALEEVFQVRPRTLNHLDCLGLKLDYEIPGQIGADRLANVLGARALGIPEGVIIDFGTATTFDVYTGNAYHGGVICPGIQTGLRSLIQNTAKLAEPELNWPTGAVGRNTDDALRIGVLHGTVGMIEGLLKGILTKTAFAGKRPTVIATGGLAHWMQGRTKVIQRFEPDLTLIGINHLLSGRVPAVQNRKKVS